MELMYEKSVAGRRGVTLPASDVPRAADLPGGIRRSLETHRLEMAVADLAEELQRSFC